jgi:hypothetical protein
MVIAGIYGWVLEPSTDPNAGHGHDDHDHSGDDDDAAALDAPESSDADDAAGSDAEGSADDGSDREPEPAMASAPSATADEDGGLR